VLAEVRSSLCTREGGKEEEREEGREGEREGKEGKREGGRKGGSRVIITALQSDLLFMEVNVKTLTVCAFSCL